MDRSAAAAQLVLMASHVADMPGQVIHMRAGIDPTVLLWEDDVDVDACTALWGTPRSEVGAGVTWLVWTHPGGFRVVVAAEEAA